MKIAQDSAQVMKMYPSRHPPIQLVTESRRIDG